MSQVIIKYLKNHLNTNLSDGRMKLKWLLNIISNAMNRNPGMKITLCQKENIFSLLFVTLVFLHHLSSQMLIKGQYAQEVDQMRNPKERDTLKDLSFFFCSIIKPRCTGEKGTLIPSAVETFSIKIKGSKSFVYSFFSCLNQTMWYELVAKYNYLSEMLKRLFFTGCNKYCGLPTQ